MKSSWCSESGWETSDPSLLSNISFKGPASEWQLNDLVWIKWEMWQWDGWGNHKGHTKSNQSMPCPQQVEGLIQTIIFITARPGNLGIHPQAWDKIEMALLPSSQGATPLAPLPVEVDINPDKPGARNFNHPLLQIVSGLTTQKTKTLVF